MYVGHNSQTLFLRLLLKPSINKYTYFNYKKKLNKTYLFSNAVNFPDHKISKITILSIAIDETFTLF